jgi:DNA polymerase kappa
VAPHIGGAAAESASALITSASAKAGMDGMDRTRIDEIILRESGTSKFMQQQRRRDAKVNQKIEEFQKRMKQATPTDYNTTPALEQRIHQWQSNQATRATCVVVDMDMFYMACELLDKPHLKNVPACVGQGMILTSNYAARKFGVRSAMPGWIGDKLVEELSNGRQRLAHVASNFDLYKQKSVQVVQVLKEFDPHLKSYSLDEAYLDLGPYLAIFLKQREREEHSFTSTHVGEEPKVSTSSWDHSRIAEVLRNDDGSREYDHVLRAVSNHTCRQALERVVHYMRNCVEQATGGLTCSAGMAPNFALAKIASDKNKPDGQCFVDPNHVLEFVRPLAVRKIPGIGRVTEKILNACQITTMQDLYDQRGLVHWLFPPTTGVSLLKASVGCMGSSSGGEDIEGETQSSNSTKETEFQKGISRERTFSPNNCWTALNSKLEDIAQLLSEDMARKKMLAHTVTVKVKLDSFDVYSRSKSLGRGVYIQSRYELVAIAAPLLTQIRGEHHRVKENLTFSCRLLGIRCSNLVEEEEFSNTPQETLDKFLCKSPLSTPKTASSYPIAASASGKSIFKSVPGTGTRPLDAYLSNESRQSERSRKAFAEITKVGSLDSTFDYPKEESQFVECPICQRKFPASENAVLNQHIDTCLNGSTVRQAVRDTKDISTDEEQPKKRHRLTDWLFK